MLDPSTPERLAGAVREALAAPPPAATLDFNGSRRFGDVVEDALGPGYTPAWWLFRRCFVSNPSSFVSLLDGGARRGDPGRTGQGTRERQRHGARLAPVSATGEPLRRGTRRVTAQLDAT